MKSYETMVIVDAMISDEAIAEELQALQSKIEAAGEVVRRDDWGKRKMAYRISKKTHGYYAVFYYKSESSLIDQIETDFRFNGNILRWLTLADHPISDAVYGQDLGNEDFGQQDDGDDDRDGGDQ